MAGAAPAIRPGRRMPAVSGMRRMTAGSVTARSFLRRFCSFLLAAWDALPILAQRGGFRPRNLKSADPRFVGAPPLPFARVSG